MPAKHAKEKKSKELNPFVLITWIIVVFWILSFFIPSGQFERVDNVVDPDSFHIVQKIHVNIFQEILTMGTSALKASGSLILSMLVVGGSLRMITETGAMDLGLDAIIKRYGDKTDVYKRQAAYRADRLVPGDRLKVSCPTGTHPAQRGENPVLPVEILAVGGSLGAQKTAVDRVFRGTFHL